MKLFKKKQYGINIDPRNPYGEIQNPIKEFVPIEERKNREFGSPVAKYPISWIDDLVGWTFEDSFALKLMKKLEPNHRRNRKNFKSGTSKHERYLRDARRPGKEEDGIS